MFELPKPSVNERSPDIVCGHCSAPIIVSKADEHAVPQAGCANCDNWADIDDAAMIASGYLRDEGQRMVERLKNSQCRSCRGEDFRKPIKDDKFYRFKIVMAVLAKP